MHSVLTYTAQIYLGLRKNYEQEQIHNSAAVKEFLKKYATKTKVCITVTDTEFIYVDGWEPGVIIGLINYPRFPSSQNDIQQRATALAEILIEKFDQQRCSVVCLNGNAETIMIERTK